MTTPNERLRAARENAGFDSAVDAADALGVPRSTYIGHENGHRGFPAKRAPQYAKRFKVTEEWLLYGKGAMEAPQNEAAEVVDIFLRSPKERREQILQIVRTFDQDRAAE